MDVEEHRKWRALNEKSLNAEWDVLDAEGLASLHSDEWMFRLSVFPSFGDFEAFGIGTTFRERVEGRKVRGEYLHEVRWKRWCRQDDGDKLFTPGERERHPKHLRPTIITRRLIVDRQLIEDLRASLASVVVPILPVANRLGLDGTGYELHAKSGGHHWINCHWWCDHPEQWQPLMSWFADTQNKLAAILDNSPETTIHNSQDNQAPARTEP